MSVDILYDSIRPIDYRKLVEEAVIGAVESQIGRWKVWLTQGNNELGFSIRIDGPDGAGFSYRFLKPNERSPEFVHGRIGKELRRIDRARIQASVGVCSNACQAIKM